MKIFLSFASNDRSAAEKIQLALLGADHEVFFDEASLPPAGDYNARIRAALGECDLYIYLISPASVGSGRYVHSELSQVKAKWPKPWGRVLPVMLERVEFDQVDPYLASATILEPDGNVAAEVVAAIPAMRVQDSRWRRILLSAMGIVTALAIIVPVGIGVSKYVSNGNGRTERVVQPFDAAQLRQELTTLQRILQTLTEKEQSRGGITLAITNYANTRDQGDWKQVKRLLSEIDAESAELDAAKEQPLFHLNQRDKHLHKRLLHVLDQKIALSERLHALPTPPPAHTKKQIDELTSIAEEYRVLVKEIESVWQALLEFKNTINA